jgi:hypothetical protein
MLRSSIRTTALALAAVFTIGAPGALAPAADAQVFRPDVMKRKAEICRNYKTIYESQVEAAVQIDGNPDGQNQSDAGAAESDQQANQTRENAQKAGCGWAA